MINTQTEFFHWLDHQLSETIPENIIAFCLNINEAPFCIELLGAAEWDADDDDWACNEDWIPHQRQITVANTLFGHNWETALATIIQMATAYLHSGSTQAKRLKNAQAFAVGFVDGDLNFIS